MIAFFTNLIDDLDSRYKRKIELYPDKHIKFFTFLTIIVLVIFGIFGVRPTIVSLIQKNKYKNGLIRVKNGLENKTNWLNKETENYEAIKPYLQNLQSAILNKPDLQNYLAEFVKVASKNGFIVKRFSQSQGSKEEIVLNVDMTGYQTGFYSLIKDIQNLNRITYIQSAELYNDSESGVKLLLKIFTLRQENN